MTVPYDHHFHEGLPGGYREETISTHLELCKVYLRGSVSGLDGRSHPVAEDLLDLKWINITFLK